MAGLNLDDIFGDVAFTPDGDTVFLSEDKDEEPLVNSSEGDRISRMARKQARDGHFESVARGGGLYTTQLYDPSKRSLVHGSAAPGLKESPVVPYKEKPQKQNQVQYVVPKKKKNRNVSEADKNARRYVSHLYYHRLNAIAVRFLL